MRAEGFVRFFAPERRFEGLDGGGVEDEAEHQDVPVDPEARARVDHDARRAARDARGARRTRAGRRKMTSH